MMAGTKVASLGELLGTRARASFRYRVNFETVGYQTIDEMKTWCEENCRGLWRHHNTYALYFQFDDDYDATMFMLKYGAAHGTT